MSSEERETLKKQLLKAISSGSKAEPNSWERVKEIRNELQTDTSNYPWREAVEDLWKEVSYAQLDDICMVNREDTSGNTPIDNLMHCVEQPRYPPMEVIIAITEAFRVYMLAGGDLELEDVLFGSRKKGVGNYAARKAKEKSYEDFDTYVQFGGMFEDTEDAKAAFQNMTLEDKAVEYLAFGRNPVFAKSHGVKPDYNNISDPESYLRGYRRWKRTTKGDTCP